MSAAVSAPRVTDRGGSGVALRPASGLCGTRRAVRKNAVELGSIAAGAGFATARGSGARGGCGRLSALRIWVDATDFGAGGTAGAAGASAIIASSAAGISWVLDGTAAGDTAGRVAAVTGASS